MTSGFVAIATMLILTLTYVPNVQEALATTVIIVTRIAKGGLTVTIAAIVITNKVAITTMTTVTIETTLIVTVN